MTISKAGGPAMPPPIPSGAEAPAQSAKLSDAQMLGGLDALFGTNLERRVTAREGDAADAPQNNGAAEPRRNAVKDFFSALGRNISSAFSALAGKIGALFQPGPPPQAALPDADMCRRDYPPVPDGTDHLEGLQNSLDNYTEGTFLRSNDMFSRAANQAVRAGGTDLPSAAAASWAAAQDALTDGAAALRAQDDPTYIDKAAMEPTPILEALFAGAEDMLTELLTPGRDGYLLDALSAEGREAVEGRVALILGSDLSDADKAKGIHTLVSQDMLLRGALADAFTGAGQLEGEDRTVCVQTVQLAMRCGNLTSTFDKQGATAANALYADMKAAVTPMLDDLCVALGMPGEMRFAG